MSAAATELLRKLRGAGWTVKTKHGGALNLEPAVTTRYGALPPGYVDFLASYDLCASPGETAWFLSEADYNGTSGSAFTWNEYELQQLTAAEGDDRWIAEIRAFWDRHMPIMLSVKDCYTYLAIEIDTGGIVHGREPEYEDVVTVAASFEALAALDESVFGGRGTDVLARSF